MPEPDPRDVKSALRQELIAWRNGQPAGLRQDWSTAANAHAADLLARAPFAVGGYWAIKSEADPLPLLSALREAGRAVALPVVTGRDQALVFRRWTPDAPLVPSGFGTSAPGPSAPSLIPDLLIVPLLGFDATGTRLGYGGGFYDRTLAHWPKRPVLLGFGFSGQRVDVIPREAHDIALDAVVTETGFTAFSNRLAALLG